MAEAFTLYQIDSENGRLTLNFHPGQSRVWDATRRFVFMLAGSQSGKTSFGPWWLWREVYGEHGRGAGDYLAVTASYDLFKLKMLPEMRRVFEDILKLGRYWSGPRIIELADPKDGQFKANRIDDPMWGRIILRSAASDSGLESSTAQAAWLDEAGQDEFTLETWEAVLRRLSLAQGRVLATTTLYSVGWLKTEVYDRWIADDPDFDVIQFRSTLNPSFPEAEYQRAQRTMPEYRFKMFYQGEFTRPPTMIYGDFTDDMLEEDFEIPAYWPRIIGVDFGGANTAVLVGARDEKNVIHIYYERLAGHQSTQDHVDTIRDEIWFDGIQVLRVLGGAKSEGQFRTDWAVAGVAVEKPPIWDFESGIGRVIALIRTNRLRVFKSLKGLRDELGSYRRQADNMGNITENVVAKRTYHRLDALRYMATGLVDAFGAADLAAVLPQAGTIHSRWDAVGARPAGWR